MNRTRFEAVLQEAVQRGLLPAGTTAAAPDSRPWPVVLLIALGAWLAAVPLLVVVGLLLGDLLQQGFGPYLVGILMLIAAVVVLRSRDLPVFVEQLALPALLVGLLAPGFGLFRDFDEAVAAALLSVSCLVLALLIPRAWLRLLLGAAAALLCAWALAPQSWTDLAFGRCSSMWLVLHLLLGLWLIALAGQGRLAPRARAALESIQAGWVLATLAGLAAGSGMTMLAGASLGSGAGGDLARMSGQMVQEQTLPMQLNSMLLAASAAGVVARQWPALRQAWCAAAGLIVAALGFWMPSLGATLLALALLATTGRSRLVGAAAVAAVWIVGAFYYALNWPLQDKALVLLGAGALLGAVGFWAWRGQRAQDAPANATRPPEGAHSTVAHRAHIGLALSSAAVLMVVNVGIWQKERLIAHGQPLFVELAPVDPRSLMQGDYMALRFKMPAVSAASAPRLGLLQATRPTVLARPDARGVATLHELPPGTAPLPGEMRLELTPQNGNWVLVTDAWFFAEGEAPRWAAARYGEFRVDGKGRALLVGLRGAQLEPL